MFFGLWKVDYSFGQISSAWNKCESSIEIGEVGNGKVHSPDFWDSWCTPNVWAHMIKYIVTRETDKIKYRVTMETEC